MFLIIDLLNSLLMLIDGRFAIPVIAFKTKFVLPTLVNLCFIQGSRAS